MEEINFIKPEFFHGIKNLTYSYINSCLKDEKLSSSYIIMIMIIYENNSLTQKEISDIIKFDKAYVNRSVNYLISENYIKKSEECQKNVKLILTEKGNSLVERVKKVFTNWRNIIVKDINKNDLQIFFDTLEKMQSNLNEIIYKKEEK